jgi:hypothetical protein
MGNASSAVLLGGTDKKYYTGDFAYYESYKCVVIRLPGACAGAHMVQAWCTLCAHWCTLVHAGGAGLRSGSSRAFWDATQAYVS